MARRFSLSSLKVRAEDRKIRLTLTLTQIARMVAVSVLCVVGLFRNILRVFF